MVRSRGRFFIPLRCILNDGMERQVLFLIEVAQDAVKAREGAGLQIQRNLMARGEGIK